MKDGNIRWDLLSLYEGEARWSSSGVQVGGQQVSSIYLCFKLRLRLRQSGYGVLGTWTGCEHSFDASLWPFLSTCH